MDMSVEPFNALEALLRTHANAHGKANPGQPFDEAMRHLMRDPDVAHAARVLSAHYTEAEHSTHMQPVRISKTARHILLQAYKLNDCYVVTDTHEKSAADALAKRGLMIKTDRPNTYAITEQGNSRANHILSQYRKQRLNARKKAS